MQRQVSSGLCKRHELLAELFGQAVERALLGPQNLRVVVGQALFDIDIALGGFYRRMAARRGGLIATMALARKLAAWYWRVMVKGDAYVEKGLADYDAQVLRTKQRALNRLAKELGQQLVPLSQAA